MAVQRATKKGKKKPRIHWEERLASQLIECGFPPPTLEFQFHDDRRWRADLAYPASRLLIEVEGGIWVQGRHTRGFGYQNDLIKYNAATLMGYRILRFSTDMVKSGAAVKVAAQMLEILGVSRRDS